MASGTTFALLGSFWPKPRPTKEDLRFESDIADGRKPDLADLGDPIGAPLVEEVSGLMLLLLSVVAMALDFWNC